MRRRWFFEEKARTLVTCSIILIGYNHKNSKIGAILRLCPIFYALGRILVAFFVLCPPFSLLSEINISKERLYIRKTFFVFLRTYFYVEKVLFLYIRKGVP